ncbi:hypothetical protein MP638_003114, partial [Amoeboaphelidium occidentale]
IGCVMLYSFGTVSCNGDHGGGQGSSTLNRMCRTYGQMAPSDASDHSNPSFRG